MKLSSKRLLSTIMAAALVTANLVDGGSIGRAFASVTTETDAEVHQDANADRSAADVDARDSGASMEQNSGADIAEGQNADVNTQDADTDTTVVAEAQNSSASQSGDTDTTGKEAASVADEAGAQPGKDDTSGASAQGSETNTSSEGGLGSEASGIGNNTAEGTTASPAESETRVSEGTVVSAGEATKAATLQETTAESPISQETVTSETASGTAVPETSVSETTVPETTLPETTAAAYKEIHVTFHVVDDLGNEISEKYDDVKVHFDSDGILTLDQEDQAPVSSIRRQTGSMLAGLIKFYSKKYSYRQATIDGEVIRAIRKSDEDGVTVYEYTTDGENWTALNEDTEVLLVYARPESDAKLYAEYLEEGKIKVTVELQKELPDGVELKVQELTPEEDNYDAYMTALAESARESETEAKTYTKDNTLLYDISFIGTDEDGTPYEYQPEGDVSVRMEFLGGQLSQELGAANAEDVEIRHLPVKEEVKAQAAADGERITADLTDLTADDILVESVKDANVTIDKTAAQAADKDEEEEVSEDASDASDAELEDNDDVESAEDEDVEETSEDTDRNNKETGYKDQTSFTVHGFSVFAFIDSNQGQHNAWNGTNSMTPNEFVDQFGITTDFGIFAENLVNNQHIESNIATDTYYIDGGGAIDALTNLYQTNKVGKITVTKTVSDGKDGTFKFAFYKSGENTPLEYFKIETKGGSGQYTVDDVQKDAKLSEALNERALLVYELDNKTGEKLEQGATSSDNYTVGYTYSDNGNSKQGITGNVISGTKLYNHIGNIVLTDGQAFNANALDEVIAHQKEPDFETKQEFGENAYFGGLTYIGNDYIRGFTDSQGNPSNGGNWVCVKAQNGWFIPKKNNVNDIDEEFQPLDNSPLRTDQHNTVGDWLDKDVKEASISAAAAITTTDLDSKSTLHVINIEGNSGDLKEDLKASNVNLNQVLPDNSQFKKDGDYLLININTNGRNSYELDQIQVSGVNFSAQFDNMAGHVIYNLLDDVTTDADGNIVSAEPYTHTVTNKTGNGVILAPCATVKQGEVYGGQAFARTFIRSGSEFHKTSMIDNHDKAHEVMVSVTNGAPIGEIQLDAEKILDGRNLTAKDKWNFTLAPVDDAPLKIKVGKNFESQKSLTTENDPNGKVTFQTIYFNRDDIDKTYKYTITESGEVANVTNDANPVRTIYIKIERGDGLKLKVTKTAESDSTQFTNVFNKATATIKVHKVLTGRAWTSGDQFAFTIKGKDNNTPMPEQAKVTVTESQEDKTSSFGEIVFNQEGTYTYTIHEENAGKTVNGLQYDSDKIVTVTVAKDETGHLKASVDHPDGGVVTFTNIYKPEKINATLSVSKHLAGREWADNDSFNFIISADPGVPMPKNNKVTVVKEKDPVSFDEITYDRPGTYEYTIEESNGGATVKGLTYDGTKKKVTVTVKDDGKGQLKASVNPTDGVVTFTNVFKTTKLILQKNWNDNNAEDKRPTSITFSIIRGSESIAEIVLTADNHWHNEINNLPYEEDPSVYTVVEEQVDGYESSISQGEVKPTTYGNQITFTATNTAKPKVPTKPTESESSTTTTVESTTTTEASTTTTETSTTTPEPSTATPETSPTTPESSSVEATTPVETTTSSSSHHEHHDHDDKPRPVSTTAAETTTSSGNEHLDDVTTPDGEVLGAERDRAHQTETSQDGGVLGANRSKVAGANRQVKTGDISMMRLYAVGAIAAIALLIGWFISWKKKQR